MDADFLRTIPFLSGLSDDELSSLVGLFTLDEIAPGTCIVEEGAAIGSLYIVTKGVVHVRRAGEDKQILLGRIEKGGFFGEVNLFDEGEATASIHAMDSVRIASIPYGVFREFLGSNPAIGYNVATFIIKELSRRLRQTNDRLLSSLYWSK